MTSPGIWYKTMTMTRLKFTSIVIVHIENCLIFLKCRELYTVLYSSVLMTVTSHTLHLTRVRWYTTT